MSTPGNIPSFLQVAAKQKHTIKDRDGEKFALEAPTPTTLMYIQDCKNCECELERKAMKVIVEGCKDCVFNLKTSLISGMMELVKCENIVLNIQENGMIWTFTIDGSNNVKVNAQKDVQFESIYLHHCTDVEVVVGSTKLPINVEDDPDRQYLIHWEKDGDKNLVCEKVIRDGIYPTTEKALAECIEKEKQFSEKMATMMVDGIKITKKPPKSKSKASGHAVKIPTQPAPKPKPAPRPAPNIEDEDEKKEFFESESELSDKLDTLAQWIKESKHCIVFTGAGISTSTGIPDFRSGMNTVLKTGPGVWELQAQRTSRSEAASVTPLLRAIPSVAHMAVVELHEEGLVKFTVSQNVDGLHLRSGVPADQLSELHGNTNLEKCTKCDAKYLRDFRTRTAYAVHDHHTGRQCDNPKCRGELIDSIINFGENLPEEDLKRSFQEARKSDLCIVLGSSLRVTPASDIPANVIRNGQKVVICNLQKTPLNPHCALEIHAQLDDVMVGVMKRLGLEIPTFNIKRRLAIDVTENKITFQGLDVARDTPYSFLRQIQIRITQSSNGKDKAICEQVLMTEPYTVSFPSVTCSEQKPLKADIVLEFHGHYGEPGIALKEEFSKIGRVVYLLSYNPCSNGVWKVTRG